MAIEDSDLPALLDRVADVFGARIDELFGLVETVHRRITQIIDGLAERNRMPDRAALASVRPLLHELLATDQPLLEGWRRDGDGSSYFVKSVVSPASVGFYDYQARDWFNAPIAAGHAVATGPY